MSTTFTHAVPRANDQSILAAFSALAQQFAVDSFTLSTISGVDETIVVAERDSSPLWKALNKDGGFQIRHVSVFIKHTFQVNFYRGGFETGGPQSPYWDHVTFVEHDRSNRLDNDSKIEVASIVQKHLGALLDQAKADAGVDHLSQLYTQYDAALGTLRALSGQFLVDLAQQREKFDQQMIGDRKRLDDEFREKKEALDKAHTDRSVALDARIKAVDDSDNKHARRAIRDKMLEDVSSRIQNFGVSTNTESKRKKVLAGFLLLFFVFAVLIGTGLGEVAHHVLYGYETVMLQASEAARATALETLAFDKMVAWGRTALGSIGLTAALVFFIRWESRWADMHATNEFQLQQFHVDVNRANWVIESALEWKKETGEVPPADLLAQLTKNLFVNQSDADADKVLHPADELASALMGTASKLKLKVGGNELEYDKPGKIPRETKSQA